jgi:hypothetical protein
MPLMLPRMPPFGNTSGLPPLLARSHSRQSRWVHVQLLLPPPPVLTAISPLQVSGHLAHDHHIEDPIKYPYLRKRDKQFPWACKDCTLFDGACKVRSSASTFWSPLLFFSFFSPGCRQGRSCSPLISTHSADAVCSCSSIYKYTQIVVKLLCPFLLLHFCAVPCCRGSLNELHTTFSIRILKASVYTLTNITANHGLHTRAISRRRPYFRLPRPQLPIRGTLLQRRDAPAHKSQMLHTAVGSACETTLYAPAPPS